MRYRARRVKQWVRSSVRAGPLRACIPSSHQREHRACRCKTPRSSDYIAFGPRAMRLMLRYALITAKVVTTSGTIPVSAIAPLALVQFKQAILAP